MTRTSPFKGLSSFEDSETDARFFFGREREREIIVANLLASRLTVLYGETGVGKSSVLHAGVARDLRALPDPPIVVVFGEWRDEPARSLEARIGAATGAELQGRIADTLELGAALAGGEVVVLLDGLEEEFLYHGSEAGPGSFLDEFSEAATRSSLRVSFLLAVREDALAKLDRFKSRVPNVFGNYLRLEHLDRTAAREAIVGPIRRYNESEEEPVEIEPALVDAVLDQVAAGKVELGQAGRGGSDTNGAHGIETPYLQLVMATLWSAEAEAGSHVLRLETLTRLGGAEQIVRDHLEGALDSLDPDQQDVAAAVFNHLVTPSGAKIAHDAADLGGYLGASTGDVQPVLSDLASQRILRPVPGARGDLPRYEIYHDILAEPVLAWRTRHESERELRQVQEAGARRHRRLLAVTATALALVAVMAIVTIYAFTQRSEARTQARKAQARALDASALSELQLDPELSLLLAVEAAKRDGGGQSEGVLRQALAASRIRGIFNAAGPVTLAEYSPDGSKILVGSAAGDVQVYDSRSRSPLVSLPKGAPVAAGGFSTDGKTFVIGRADGRVQVRATADGELEHVLANGAAVRGIGVDPTGRRLVTLGGHTVKVWNAATGGLAWKLRLAWPVTRAVFSPSGRLVAVVGNNRDAAVYEAASGRLLHRFDQGDFVKSVAFSPKGAYLATGGRNKTARIWNLTTGRLVVELVGHAQDVVALAFSPDGKTLATGSTDGTARTWSVPSGAPQATFTGHANAITSVAFSPDARYLLTASSDRTARLWTNSASPQVVALFAGDSDAVTTASFSPDGRRVLTASDDGTARLWDPGQPTLRVLAREPGPVTGAAYVGSGEIAVAGPRLEVIRAGNGAAVGGLRIGGAATAEAVRKDGKLIAVAFGRQVALVTAPMKARLAFRQKSVITGIAFSPDGTRIATAGTDGIGRIWTVGGRLLLELKGHRRALTGIAFSPDGKLVATSSRDATAKIWDAHTGRLLHTLQGHTKSATSVAFSPDGRSVVTASEDHDGRVWSVASGTTTQVLRWHFGTVADAQFSPDGRWIVTAGPQTAQLWQPGVQDPFFQFGIGGPAKALTSSVFDASSRIVLATDADGTVRTYECDLCGDLDQLLRLARTRLALTGSRLSAADLRRFGG